MQKGDQQGILNQKQLINFIWPYTCMCGIYESNNYIVLIVAYVYMFLHARLFFL